MRFKMAGGLLFAPTIRGNNVWLYVFVVARAASELAGRATPDRATWHFCLGHLGADLLEKAIEHGLGANLRLNLDSASPALCKPCIHGKQHCDQTLESRAGETREGAKQSPEGHAGSNGETHGADWEHGAHHPPDSLKPTKGHAELDKCPLALK
jgi:hypothetical protein